MTWTDEADRLLVTLWEQGRSLHGVADGMRAAGFKVNHNMIAGRKHLLRRRGVEITVREQPARFGRKAKHVNGVKVVAKANGVVMHDNGVDYMALTSNGCKAILDKRGSDHLPMCCGRQRVEGRPYCQPHLSLYVTEKPARRF